MTFTMWCSVIWDRRRDDVRVQMDMKNCTAMMVVGQPAQESGQKEHDKRRLGGSETDERQSIILRGGYYDP